VGRECRKFWAKTRMKRLRTLGHRALFSRGTCLHFSFLVLISDKCSLFKSRDSAVGIVIGYVLDGLGVWLQFPVETKFLSLSMQPRPGLGPIQDLIECVLGDFSLEIKRPWREASNCPLSSAQVKETRIYTSTQIYTESSIS
jgi:hypothetical protein